MKFKKLKYHILMTSFLLAAFVNTLHPNLLFADTHPSPAPSIASIDDFDKVCKDVLKNSNNKTQQPQKYQYCESADSAREAANASGILWKVWAAVGGVCTAACIASFAGFANQYICVGASVAGGIADAAITKNFMNALMGIAGAGSSIMVNNMMNNNNNDNAPKKDIGACISAAMAAYQTYTKYTSMESSTKTAESSLTHAMNLNETAGSGTAINSNLGLASPLIGGNTSSNGITGIQNTPIVSASSTSQSPCSSTANAGMMLQCAFATDSNLPRFANSPRFLNDFKKSSGTDLDSFLGKNEPPGRMLASASGGALNSDQSIKLSAALKQMEQQLDINPTSSVYASGGGGARKGGDDFDPQLGNLMSNIMNQFGGKKEDPNQLNGLNQVFFANKNHPISSIPENRTLSLFDRITYRYYLLGNRMLGGGI